MITVDLPIKTGSGLNDRKHWAVRSRETKRARGTACLLVRAKLMPWEQGCTVTLTRLSAGTLDDDNLRGAMKACRDGVADALGVQDNDKRVKWEYAQEKCKRGAYGVRIQIEQA